MKGEGTHIDNFVQKSTHLPLHRLSYNISIRPDSDCEWSVYWRSYSESRRTKWKGIYILPPLCIVDGREEGPHNSSRFVLGHQLDKIFYSS